MSSGPLLSLRNVTITLQTETGQRDIVRNLNLDICPGEIVALVGLSASGKSTTAFAILRLLSEVFRVTQGQIFFEGDDILEFSPQRLRSFRSKNVGMIFQDPLNAFDPLFTVGFQIQEVLAQPGNLTNAQMITRVHELLEMVEVPDPRRVAGCYPHELSGGLRQRAMIAQALASSPQLVIADEPTSNLDVTIQARVMELFLRLRDTLRFGMLLISHDLKMVEQLSDRIAILSDGEIVEQGHPRSILTSPQHAFTQRLVKAFA